jgi:predicted transcriptional regulator
MKKKRDVELTEEQLATARAAMKRGISQTSASKYIKESWQKDIEEHDRRAAELAVEASDKPESL